MAGHALLKFVMTECSKTQIRLAGLIRSVMFNVAFDSTETNDVFLFTVETNSKLYCKSTDKYHAVRY